jgi:hypothetical protein
MFNGKIHFKWPFSIATLNYQRVFDPEASSNIEIKDCKAGRFLVALDI